MDLDRIRELLQVVAESDVAEVEIEEGGLKLVVRKDSPTVMLQPAMPYMPTPYGLPQAYPPPPVDYGAAAPAPGPAPAAGGNPEPQGEAVASNVVEVKAPIVGTFYRSPSPEADPFVQVGDAVSAGDVLCIIEAMKLMNEIEAEESGVIRRILVENAQAVEFDQPLFEMEPS